MRQNFLLLNQDTTKDIYSFIIIFWKKRRDNWNVVAQFYGCGFWHDSKEQFQGNNKSQLSISSRASTGLKDSCLSRTWRETEWTFVTMFTGFRKIRQWLESSLRLEEFKNHSGSQVFNTGVWYVKELVSQHCRWFMMRRMAWGQARWS